VWIILVRNEIFIVLVALDICAGDTKALYRRCQAYENLKKYDEAYKDARRLVELEPSNKAIQPMLRQLHCIVQDKVRLASKIK